MRKITVAQIAVFTSLALAAIAAGAFSTSAVLGNVPLGDFRGVVLTLAGVILFYAYAIVAYRAFIGVFPLRAGEIAPDSAQETIYHIYILFYLILFYPVIRSGLLPTPLMRLFYLALGARLGPNTYSQGILHDPPFVEIGGNSTIGQSALLIPHVIEGNRLAHYPIRIGSHVTIGAHAVILSDVVIMDGAMIATGAVVIKGTRIGENETWGGVPARRIKQ